jgi:hypothetical protein
MWQLYQAGFYPDTNGNWPIHLLSKNGDFDKDGLSDWTSMWRAPLPEMPRSASISRNQEKLAASVRFEFYAITGKTYTIERSTDMQTWTRATFSMDAPGAGSAALTGRRMWASAAPSPRT